MGILIPNSNGASSTYSAPSSSPGTPTRQTKTFTDDLLRLVNDFGSKTSDKKVDASERAPTLNELQQLQQQLQQHSLTQASGLSFTRWLGGIVPVRPTIYGPQTVFTPHQYQPLCPPLNIPQISKLHQQQIPSAATPTPSSSPIQSASSVVSAISPPPPASITPVGSPIRTPPLRLNSKDRSSSP